MNVLRFHGIPYVMFFSFCHSLQAHFIREYFGKLSVNYVVYTLNLELTENDENLGKTANSKA